GRGAPAEMAIRTLSGIASASCHLLQSAGTPGKAIAASVAAARLRASGKTDPTKIRGTPCNSRGKTKFENPYECVREMTPRLGQVRVKPMVATMLSASAWSWLAVKATNRGTPVVAEVAFRCTTDLGNGPEKAVNVCPESNA